MNDQPWMDEVCLVDDLLWDRLSTPAMPGDVDPPGFSFRSIGDFISTDEHLDFLVEMS